MQKRTKTILAVGMALAGLVGGAGAASATGQGANTCAAGYVCLWADNTYTGHHLTDADHIYVYGSVKWDDNCFLGLPGCPDNAVNSLTNRFRICNLRVWTGEALTGSSMTFSRPSLGGQYQDPNLTNGGPGTTADWHDKISSHTEVSC